MATLEKIRNRAGVLVAVVIGMALLAFILGDLLKSGGTLFSNSQFEIAKISDKSISYQSFQNNIKNLSEITKYTSGKNSIDEASMQKLRNQTWQQVVRQNVMEDPYKNLGISISSDELWDMVQGKNIHPIIKQLFTNPETGQVNTLAILNFLKTYDKDPSGQKKSYWLFIEDQIVQEERFTKYLNLVKQGLNVTEIEAENEISNSNRQVNLNFIVKRLSTVPDSAISITESDIKDYYNNHKQDYKQDASRTIEYVTFDVLPSKEDTIASKDWISDIKIDFQNTNNNAEFVNLNSDESYIDKNYTKEELSDNISEFMFSSEVDAIYDTYFEDKAYKLAKLSEINYVPDSVKARHILIQPNRNSKDNNKIIALADSLKQLIKNGTDFSSLAEKFSEDKGSAEDGGNLGWIREGQMVKSFSDTCFSAKIGETKLVNSNYGIHIVQVTKRAKEEKKVKVAIISRKLEPSSTTYNNIYSEASKFAGTNIGYDKFEQAIKENPNLTKHIAKNIKENDKEIPGLDSPRNLIRAVYNIKDEKKIIKTDNNPIFELGNRFVIAFLKEIRVDGIADLDQVEDQINVKVRYAKKGEKIAEQLQEQLNESNNISDIANKLNVQLLEANNITFNSFSLPGVGIEPKIISTASVMGNGDISKPIIGNNGVYVISINSVSENQNNINIAMQKDRLLTQYKNRSSYEAYEALKTSANIVDKRAKFY
ncbi:MAG: SurA N-terminal domain-containing protein [Bacteroidales bacterium]|jgi:peptidyl-prolyl cis-trans isomerase D|nr:SurA N-terminal domain-containing protein [Bacteroidales bacterium]